MRSLNIEELETKIHDYAIDVECVDKQHLRVKLYQFVNFLESQPISNRILQRFSEDFIEIKEKIPKPNTQHYLKQKRELVDNISTPELQGALGYFLIRQTFDSARIYDNSFLDLTHEWFNSRGNFDQWKNDFNTFVFKPFVELLNWYISESQSYNEQDYFSKNEINEFSYKIDDLLQGVRLGQEVLFEELQDLKEQLKSIKKKNWGELLKGKLFDLTLNNVISVKTFSMVFKAIIGEDINFLEAHH
jgi:hypothetical protein